VRQIEFVHRAGLPSSRFQTEGGSILHAIRGNKSESQLSAGESGFRGRRGL